MKQVFVHASWFALATVVYFGGRYTVTPPDASPATVAPTKVREPSPKLASGNVSSGAQLLDSATVVPEWFGDELLCGNKMRGIVVEISMCEDSLLRQTILFSRLLTKLTENNAEATLWHLSADNSPR